MTRYKRNDGNFLISQLGSELVLMDTKTGEYMGVNAVGTLIWNLLAEPRLITELVGALTQQFEVSEAQCKAEVEQFIADLDKRKLVSLV